MRMSFQAVVPLAALAVVGSSALAQEAPPTTQPTLLTIYMEEVKPGHEAAHERIETGWPTAFEKAGSPDIYLAMESLTGPPMVWFVQPYENYAAEGRAMARIESDPVLSAELGRLWQEHAPHIASSRVVQAMGRPDLSGGPFPDLTTQRFWDITMFRIRPGHDDQFAEAAKLYIENAARSAPETSFRTYQVTAGLPGGTYFIFSSVADYAEFDAMMARDMAVWESMSEDDMAVFDAFASEALQNGITHRFRLSPTMSYVDETMKAADPEFWSR